MIFFPHQLVETTCPTYNYNFLNCADGTLSSNKGFSLFSNFIYDPIGFRVFYADRCGVVRMSLKSYVYSNSKLERIFLTSNFWAGVSFYFLNL